MNLRTTYTHVLVTGGQHHVRLRVLQFAGSAPTVRAGLALPLLSFLFNCCRKSTDRNMQETLVEVISRLNRVQGFAVDADSPIAETAGSADDASGGFANVGRREYTIGYAGRTKPDELGR